MIEGRCASIKNSRILDLRPFAELCHLMIFSKGSQPLCAGVMQKFLRNQKPGGKLVRQLRRRSYANQFDEIPCHADIMGQQVELIAGLPTRVVQN